MAASDRRSSRAADTRAPAPGSAGTSGVTEATLLRRIRNKRPPGRVAALPRPDEERGGSSVLPERADSRTGAAAVRPRPDGEGADVTGARAVRSGRLRASWRRWAAVVLAF